MAGAGQSGIGLANPWSAWTMTSSRPVYIVRQSAVGQVVFVVTGVLFCAFPWFPETDAPLSARIAMTTFGVLALAIGLVSWRWCRTAIVVDRRGIWCSGYSCFRLVLVPWTEAVRATTFTWSDREGQHEGVVLQLRPDAAPPSGRKLQSVVQSQIRRILGDLDASNPLILSHDEWDWEPEEFVRLVTRCLEDPEERNRLGIYAKAQTRGRA